jgi:protein-S-isoprenylcysteine O-methyltransferase Ste14
VARVVGIVVGVAGLPLIVAAQETMGASWRIGVDPEERTELVTAGVFRLSRNPIYTGMVAMAVGVALMVPNRLSVAAVGLYVLVVELQVRGVEEPYLRGWHGSNYEGWAATSGRFLPGVGKRPSSASTAR